MIRSILTGPLVLVSWLLLGMVTQSQGQTCSTVKDGSFTDPSTFTCTGGATSPLSGSFAGTINITNAVSIPSGATVQIQGLTTINVSGGGILDLGNSSILDLANAGSSIYLVTASNDIRGGNNHTILSIGTSTCEGPFQGNQNNNGNGTHILGPKKFTQSTGCQGLAPDLTSILYARPSTVIGSTNTSLVVDVIELNNVASSGQITLKISKDAKYSFTFDPMATSVNGRTVLNSAWSFNGPAGGFYTLTTNQVIAAGGVLSFGLAGTLIPGGTAGSLTVSATIVGGSGGEDRLNNDTDADKIDYFQQ